MPRSPERSRRFTRILLAATAALCACHLPKSKKHDAGAAVDPRSESAPQPKTSGKTHSEIKGAIHHRKGEGPDVLEAGGTKDGLDPVNCIWGSGPTDIYAAAWDDPGKGLLHSKGDGVWSHENLSDRRLRAVWGSGPKDVYVGGNDGIYHGHGDGVWNREFSGSRGAISAIWGWGPKRVYAAGAYGEVFQSNGDGKWTKSFVGNDKALLLAIWGIGPHHVYFASTAGTIYHTTGNGVFTAETLPVKKDVTGIWGSKATDVYAVAGGLFHSGGDGHWEAVNVEGLTRAKSIWGDAAGTLWVGGYEGRLFRRRAGVWTSTQDKSAGTYQTLWGIGDQLYLGAELYYAWTDP